MPFDRCHEPLGRRGKFSPGEGHNPRFGATRVADKRTHGVWRPSSASSAISGERARVASSAISASRAKRIRADVCQPSARSAQTIAPPQKHAKRRGVAQNEPFRDEVARERHANKTRHTLHGSNFGIQGSKTTSVERAPKQFRRANVLPKGHL